MIVSGLDKYGKKSKLFFGFLSLILLMYVFNSTNKNRIFRTIYRGGISFSSGQNTGQNSSKLTEVEMKLMLPMSKEYITFDDIIIIVRTTTKNTNKRMPVLFDSWLPDALKRIKSLYVTSDGEDPELSMRLPGESCFHALIANGGVVAQIDVCEMNLVYAQKLCRVFSLCHKWQKSILKSDGHFINSKCGKTHSRENLWCKISKALSLFSETDKKWFCHFDDDMYVNIDNLLGLLSEYNSNGTWYIGRRPLTHPHYIPKARYSNVKVWCHNLGAGICFSRGLINKMKPIIRNDGFAKIAPSIGLVDDMVLGFIVNHKLRIPFTESHLFHSQYENMSLIRDLEQQVTLGYEEKENNYLDVEGFRVDEDPHRFRSLHCKIHPEEDMCRILWKRKAVLNITSSDITHLLIIYVPFLTLTIIVFRFTRERRKSTNEQIVLT